MMERTQIYLTREEREGLRTLAELRSQTQSELIRVAVDRLLKEELPPASKSELLEQSFGIWADRDDLDELFAELRQEWDERIESWQ